MVKFDEGTSIFGDLDAKLTLPNHVKLHFVKNNPPLLKLKPAVKMTQKGSFCFCGYSGLLGHTAAILGPSDGYKRTIREVIVRI